MVHLIYLFHQITLTYKNYENDFSKQLLNKFN